MAAPIPTLNQMMLTLNGAHEKQVEYSSQIFSLYNAQTSEIDQLTKTVAELRVSNSILTTERVGLTETVAGLDKTIVDLKADATRAAGTAASLYESIRGLEDSNERLTSSLNHADDPSYEGWCPEKGKDSWINNKLIKFHPVNCNAMWREMTYDRNGPIDLQTTAGIYRFCQAVTHELHGVYDPQDADGGGAAGGEGGGGGQDDDAGKRRRVY